MCHVRVAEASDDMWDCRQDNEVIKAGPQFVQGYERNFILKTKLSALIPADACWQICNCPIVHLEPGLCKDCGGGSDSCHQGPGPGTAGTRVIGCNQQQGCTQLYLSIKARHVVMVVTDVFTLVS